MGDMKTPDFDDLLAAFDIPDIDAKEAIQSSPEEERDAVGANAAEREDGLASCFTGPPAPQSDPPVVSVIVKNVVRSESLEEKSVRDKTDNPSSSALASQVQDRLDDLTSQLGPRLPADVSMAPQIANGFGKSVLGTQGHTESWSQSSPLRSMLNDAEDNSDKNAEPRSVQHTNEVLNSLRPLLFPQSTTTAGPLSSPPLSPHTASPHFSPRSTPLQDNPGSSPLAQNGSKNTEIKDLMHTDEDDSEPDLGSPLVIHETPEFEMSPPPKFKHRRQLQPKLLASAETTSSVIPHPPNLSPAPKKPQNKSKHEGDEQLHVTSSPPSSSQPKSTQDCLLSVRTSSVREEKYPEHVIDERDSPESPPPSEMGLAVPRSSSPDLGSTKDPTTNNKEIHQQDELRETEHSQEDKPGDNEELSEKVAGDGETFNEENCDAGTEDASDAKKVSSPLRSLKVKIKMPTGSITRTVTGVTPKRSGRVTAKDLESSKPSLQRHNTRSKQDSLQQPQLSAVTILQDACAATLESTNAVKEKTTGDTKPKVFPSAASSRPASIVNSTGAIISKSQTNLVEAFNKILNNKNLLPNYKPDLNSPLPAEWGISLPAQGYRCLECGDTFALEQSLVQHYDRRSLRIEVTCNHCAKRLAFFNKCSLLLHAREHKERGLIMQCSHLVMKPVPVEQMITQPEPTAAGQATPKPGLPAHQAGSTKKAEAAQSINKKCPECQTQFSSKEEVADHFQEIKPAHSTSCTECSPPMLLPNGCSSAAHQRIHQGCAPHVCPECGCTAKQAQLQKHLSDTCLHFSRRIGYRCSSCLVVFGGLNSVKSHIQQAHCDMFHKCPSCPMAFKSAPSIQSHITAQHPTLTEGQTMLIYKCVMCDTVFTHKPLLYAHFDTHLINQKVHVFKCPQCTKLFSQRSSLLDHFKTHKTLKEEPTHPAASSGSQPSVKPESSDGEDWMGEEKEDKVKTKRVKAPSGWKCFSCHTCYTDREEYISHMSERHGKILKKFPCNKCESSFTTTSSMRRHIRDKHKNINRGFRCQFCAEGKKVFSSRAMLDRHVQLRHSMDTGGQDTLMGGRDEADSSSEHDSGLGARWRHRGVRKMEQDEESTGSMSPVKKLRASSSSSSAPATYSHPESGFRCGPCGFTTEVQATFLEHISQHRRGATEDGGLQCLQCGACFTSSSSLSRHRFIIHKVREDNQPALSVQPAHSPANSRNHEEKNFLNGSAPASPSSQPTTGQWKEEEGSLACKVCGKHFEKATDLNTHFRTHGMAFINARNAGKVNLT
ncbi:zinc finger protein 687a isoform X2 [Parambassis ranga]|uniref:Zinc finger protein 687a isoform X2 n=1 Tax=Parambassis ranga TaxID=210632 RepID=A0A6P7JX34_9TELE|nr:zinc finger protein 687a-like isoform X2 [Parambassis ranga]